MRCDRAAAAAEGGFGAPTEVRKRGGAHGESGGLAMPSEETKAAEEPWRRRRKTQNAVGLGRERRGEARGKEEEREGHPVLAFKEDEE